MPLSPMELHEEELGQLRRLVQSPGWGLFNNLVHKRVQSREQEKARVLRASKPEEMAQAVRFQAEIDGLRESLDLVHQYMEGLEEDLQPKEAIGSYT